MADSFTPNLDLTRMENGTHNNTWNDEYISNDDRIDAKFGDITTVNTTGGTTVLTAAQERVNVIKVTGTLVSNATIEFTGVGGSWIIQNDTSGSFTLTCKINGQTGVVVAQGATLLVYYNGTDIDLAGSLFQANADNGFTARQTITVTSAGAATIPLSLVNSSVTASTEVALDLTPSTAGVGVRGAQVSGVQEGSNVIRLSFKSSGTGGAAPSQRGYFKDGFVVGTPTGTDKGAGTINATTIYENGTSLVAKYQIIDTELSALAGLTSAADKVPYFTGPGTAAVADFTAFGRSLVDDADAATARATLGLTYGSQVQAWDQQLQDISALAVTDNNFIVGNGTTFVAESGATARASMGVTIGTHVEAWDQQLDDIAALAVTDSNFIVGNGTTWVAESGATARTSMGVGTGDSPTFTGLTLTGSLAANGGGTLGDAVGDTVVIKGATVTSFAASLLDDNAASNARSTLGLGTSATVDTGTSGTKIPLLDASNTWSAAQSIDQATAAARGLTITKPGDANPNLYLDMDVVGSLAGDRYVTFGLGGSTRGTITVDSGSGIDYNDTSDGRIKFNRAPLSDADEILDSLNPLWFNWNNPDGPRDFGLVAQEVAETKMGFKVHRGDDNPDLKPGDPGFELWMLDYTHFVPLLIASRKNMASQIADLTRRLAKLEGR